MKKYRIALLCLLLAPGVSGAVTKDVTVTLKGTALSASCKVVIRQGSTDNVATLDLGTGTDDGWGGNSLIHGTVKKDFTVRLSGCKGGGTAQLFFTGTGAPSWSASYYKNTSAAGNKNDNLALRLQYKCPGGTLTTIPPGESKTCSVSATSDITDIGMNAALVRRFSTTMTGAYKAVLTANVTFE